MGLGQATVPGGSHNNWDWGLARLYQTAAPTGTWVLDIVDSLIGVLGHHPDQATALTHIQARSGDRPGWSRSTLVY